MQWDMGRGGRGDRTGEGMEGESVEKRGEGRVGALMPA